MNTVLFKNCIDSGRVVALGWGKQNGRTVIEDWSMETVGMGAGREEVAVLEKKKEGWRKGARMCVRGK